MTRGTLDRRPRSASSERPGSRASSVSSDEPQVVSRSPSGLSTRLDALRNENANPQVSTMTLNDDNYLEDEPSTSESSLLQNHTDEDAKAMPTNRKHRDCKTQEALVEMARLDFVLAASELKLNQVKLQRKEWSQKRWSEYMSIPRTYESTAEAENTKSFLALEAPHQGKKNMTHLPEVDDSPHFTPIATPQGKSKKDFVKRNIELAGDTGGPYRMTPAEKARLAELLKESDEEEEPALGGAGDQEGDPCVSSFATSHASTLEPVDLERQRHIKYQLSLLGPLGPAEDFFPVFLTGSESEATGSDAIWGLGGESWASSRCAVDYLRKKTAGEASSPRDTTAAEDINPEIPRISAEQLRSLLEEAEQCQRSHPRPPISKAKLAALLKDPYTTSFSHSGPFPADD
ncbi:unnamed protein product [Gadus morhua 'NCC']